MGRKEPVPSRSRLLSSFETVSAELSLAMHQLRDGIIVEENISWLRTDLLAIKADLAELDPFRQPTFPQSRIPQNYPNNR
jgi:hypothetical protein